MVNSTLSKNNIKYHHMVSMGVWEMDVPEINIEHWIKVCYSIKENNSKSKSRSNYGGYQSPNNIHQNPIFFPLIEIINKYHYEITKSPIYSIDTLWVNISPFGSFNTFHTHGNFKNHKALSGILYLKTPPKSGKVVFQNPLDVNNAFFSRPVPGKILFFPNYLGHFVEPNLSHEDRISIAFNYE